MNAANLFILYAVALYTVWSIYDRHRPRRGTARFQPTPQPKCRDRLNLN